VKTYHAYHQGTFRTRRAAVIAARDFIRDRNRPAGTPSTLFIIRRGPRAWDLVTGTYELTHAGTRFHGPITDANLNAYMDDWGVKRDPILPAWVGERI
jgi:hypothetical protein